ncbi:MAG: antibiotic biosynthesis monooxygenase [Proteobacteria bacterium]|nr:antibiotic biosynthesis monooxygenase [Pseudomonadota bacterium]
MENAIMAALIMISRRISKEQKAVVASFVNRLCVLAAAQDGYMGGETFVSYEEPEEHLTISTWRSLQDWNTYSELEESKDLHYKIDLILGRATKHQIYLKNSYVDREAS